MKWLVPVFFLINACSLVYYADFTDVGKKLTVVPAALRGKWTNTGLGSASFIEEFVADKSGFSIKFSGSDGKSEAIPLSDSTVRLSFRKPFYIVQLKTEKGILLNVLKLSGDTLTLLQPDFGKLGQECSTSRKTGALGIQEFYVDASCISVMCSEPDKYFLPGDSFTKQKRKH